MWLFLFWGLYYVLRLIMHFTFYIVFFFCNPACMQASWSLTFRHTSCWMDGQGELIVPWTCAITCCVACVGLVFWFSCQIEWDLDVAIVRWFCPSGADVVSRNILLSFRSIPLPMRLELRVTGHILLTGWIVVVEPFGKHSSHAYAIN